MNINDVLNQQQEPVQSLKKAKKEVEDIQALKERADKFIGQGRPTVSDYEKKKKRVIYFSDEEMEKIEKVAKSVDMKPMQFVKFCLFKELRKEGVM